MTDDGAIITEKLAKLFGLKVGSTFTIQNSDNDPFEIRVAGISENYTLHYVYMTPKYYEEIFDAKPKVNSQLLRYDMSSSIKRYIKITPIAFIRDVMDV